MNYTFIFLILLSFKTWSQDLSSGEWIKLEISKTGIYQLDKAFFERHAPQYLKTNLQHIKIFTGQPGILPQSNAAQRIEGLKEVPLWLSSNSTSWSKQDKIVFYAQGAHEVKINQGSISHFINPYSDKNYYYVTIGNSPSKRIQNLEYDSTNIIKEFLPFYEYQENESQNLLHSGRLWLGDLFKSNYSFKVPIEDFDSDFQLSYDIYPRGIATQYIKTSGKSTLDTLLGSSYLPNDNIARYNRISNRHNVQVNSSTPIADWKLQLSSDQIGNAGVYFDFWKVQYNRKLKFIKGRQIAFIVPNQVLSYNGKLSDFKSETAIWQILDPFNSYNVLYDKSGYFSPDNTESSLYIFDMNELPKPLFKEKVKNQKLKISVIPELLVVYPEKFKISAENLIRYKSQTEGLEILGVTVEEIYNEFSSGRIDPTAIRDYCRYLFRQNPEKFKYLLLLGDATYDYKNNNKSEYVNTDLFVPTYQSRESLEPIYSYASDDYFTFLDDHEGEWPEGNSTNNQWSPSIGKLHFMDISVGRIPARSIAELNNYIEKYKVYTKVSTVAEWKNRIAFVADNRDYNLHQENAEKLEALALKTFSGLETKKLYIDDFPIEKESGSSPLAIKKMHDLVNDGTFLISYIGHGAEDGLSDEKLVSIKDIVSYNNTETLPIWLTATCQFGKFDNPGVVSAAELLLIQPNNGAIALLTTTRPVFANTNQLVNEALFRNISQTSTLGELFQITKNQSISGEVNRNFSLLGDPSLKLPMWNHSLKVKLSTDTLKAFSKVILSGTSQNIKEGTVFISIFDKPGTKTTIGNFSDSPAFTYTLNSERIYLGKFTIKNYQFVAEIQLSENQFTGQGKGRMTLEGISTDSTIHEFSGEYPVYLASATPPPHPNNTPPEISVNIDSKQNLHWIFHDSDGLNLSDFSNNWSLEFRLNGEIIQPVKKYLHLIEGSETSEIIFYTGNLPPGNYRTSLRIADIYNMVSKKTFEFEITKPKVQISSVNAYPNPVTDFLIFKINHNQSGADLYGSFEFYDSMGRHLQKQDFSCSTCAENITVNIDIGDTLIDAQNVFYRLILSSSSKKSQDTWSGRLFFWK